ncbi:hypothetical protein CBF90_00245 [Microbacterium sp. AISO3]|uniref:LacI family DNA-binding transcriptional regulator n=1 Tax=Microbacterium sp. AISO3 TaxID=2002831 RepID=UPI000B4D4BEF|nr:LacI family DNA-binding transcriptional regulator [Microbacterium sp. AISO3]OWP23227.1 hypothetical protein CBF90_00245 [Microbacterium sp. AISO3]
MARKAISLRDVAAVAGVSVSTVSKVLRGQGKASDATRERIFEAAERLDFQPNALGQFLVQGRSATVGVLTMNAPGAFTMPVLTGATTTLGTRDLSVLVTDSHLDRTVLAATVRKLRARSIDGLLVVGDGSGSEIRSVTAGFPAPVVYVYGISDDAADASFVHDGYAAGKRAGEHLLASGRRRIAHITASADDHSARERADGLAAALAAAGTDLAPELVLRGDWSRGWGREAAERLIASGERFDAVCCGNDTIARAVIAALAEAGVRVPEDVAITGMDNISGLTGQDDESLTTIDFRLADLGARAAAHLADVIDGQSYEPGLHRIAGDLVAGESTAAPSV